MKIKKIIAGFSAMALASAMSLSALAVAEPEGTRITNESQNKTGNMTATYTVAPGYMVTIPAGAVIADSDETATAQQIKAENVILGDRKKLVVTLTGATNTTEEKASKFNAKNGDSTVKYSIKAGGKAVTLGGEVASFENKAEEQTVDVKFFKDSTSTPTLAGDHTEQLTFTISVEDAFKTLTIVGYTIPYNDNDTWAQIAATNDLVTITGENIVKIDGRLLATTNSGIVYSNHTINPGLSYYLGF